MKLIKTFTFFSLSFEKQTDLKQNTVAYPCTGSVISRRVVSIIHVIDISFLFSIFAAFWKQYFFWISPSFFVTLLLSTDSHGRALCLGEGWRVSIVSVCFHHFLLLLKVFHRISHLNWNQANHQQLHVNNFARYNCVQNAISKLMMIYFLSFIRTSVRLGEYDTSSDPDCSTSGFCAPTVINHLISHVVIHPDYKHGQYHHDIALIILKTPLNYTGEQDKQIALFRRKMTMFFFVLFSYFEQKW